MYVYIYIYNELETKDIAMILGHIYLIAIYLSTHYII